MEELQSPIESRYYNIGTGLRLRVDELDDIDEKFGKDPLKALQRVVRAWLQEKYKVSKFGRPTWQMLAKVIDSHAGGNDHELAEEIARNHPAAGGASKGYYIQLKL